MFLLTSLTVFLLGFAVSVCFDLLLWFLGSLIFTLEEF